MKNAGVIPLEVDLALFSQWLTVNNVVHRIVEEQGGQVLLLQDQRYHEQMSEVLRQYIQDESFRENLKIELARVQNNKSSINPPVKNLALYPRAKPSEAPIIFLLIGLSVLIAVLTDFGKGGSILRAMLIVDPFQSSLNLSLVSDRWNALLDALIRGEVWRLLSPDFIHFNVMHITFNLLMIWVLGGQLEIQKGSASFLSLVIFVSIISNIAQLLDTGYLFGGLSGVVYGLVGYCWAWKFFDKDIFFPSVLLKFSLVWLMLGYTPLTEWLGLGRMANSAHLYGLIAGLVWAGITLYVNEVLLKKSQPMPK